jgi:hypothetical protein
MERSGATECEDEKLPTEFPRLTDAFQVMQTYWDMAESQALMFSAAPSPEAEQLW